MQYDSDDDWSSRKDRIIGLGERSFRKSYYPQLRKNLGNLERFRTLVDRASEFMILIFLDTGNIADANAALGRLLGSPVAALIDHPLSSLGLGDADQILDILRRDADAAIDDERAPTHSVTVQFAISPESVWLEISYRIARLDDGCYGVLVGRDITDRKKADAEFRMATERLRASEQRFREMAENIDQVFFIADTDYSRFHYISPAFTAVWGREPALLHENPGAWLEWLHPDDRERVVRHIRDNIGTGHYSASFRMVRPDGEVRWLTAKAFEVDSHEGGRHVVGSQIDITERMQAEQALAHSEASLRSIFEQASVGVALIDTETGRFLRINQQYCDMLGASVEEMQQTNFMEVTHPDDLQSDLDNMARLRSGEIRRFSMEKRYFRKNGELIWVSLDVSPTWAPDQPPTTHIAVVQDITDRKRAEAEIHSLAFFDTLTNLPNRRLLMDRLQQSMVASARSTRHRALLFLDLDNFKTLNDTMGHDVGDQILIQAAQRIRTCVREVDTVSRLGGDEFIVLLEQLDEDVDEAADHARIIGDKIIAALGVPYGLGDSVHRGTVSIGVTIFRGRDVSVDELLKRADLAMYQAKAAGRNALRFFDPRMQAAVHARSMMENELHQAIANSEFSVHFQPQVDSAGSCVGVEALLRWNNPNRGMVPPGSFIPLAEETGLIIPIGRWVLRHACRIQREWRQRPETSHLVIAVNVSARQFRETDFVDDVHMLIRQTGADPRRIKLEVTESLLLDDIETVIIKMGALKGIGVGFALDDFGTGYSSLSYLKRLPLDQVKIDRSFVRDILVDPNDSAICHAITALAESLGLDVIAEGVETENQWRLLESAGCKLAQGYYFGRPMALGDFERWLQDRASRMAAPIRPAG